VVNPDTVGLSSKSGYLTGGENMRPFFQKSQTVLNQMLANADGKKQGNARDTVRVGAVRYRGS